MKTIVEYIFSSLLKTPTQGAQTQIYLAVDPDLENITGKYFSNCTEKTPSKAAQNDETAKWLYEKSMSLVGL
jgi:hypothetical protein